MPGIHSVTVFYADDSDMNVQEYLETGDAWPFSLTFAGDGTYVYLHLSEKKFIKLKNAILSLDRQREEARRCQNLQRT
jgi:hypothetical protein